MAVISLFEDIDTLSINKMIKCFDARKLIFKKDTTILTNMSNTTIFGVVLSGTANIIRVDYNGTRTIIERLSDNSIFGGPLYSSYNNELSVISTSDIEVLEFDYYHIVGRCKKNCECHAKLLDNMLQILSNKILKSNEKLLIMSKKTIREKLLEYFNINIRYSASKSFKLELTLTDLADYLAIDRSAMMREIKNLKEDGLIEIVNKKVYIKF